MARIGLYGGTFNPIHNGHLGVCRKAVEQLHLDRLHLVPTYVPPHKAAPDLASGEDRLAMCRLAAEEISAVFVDDRELVRGGVSYTIDTLRDLHHKYPDDELYLLMGSDNYLTFEQWRSWREICELCTLAVASRETDDRPVLYHQSHRLALDGARTIFLANEVQVISSTELRQEIKEGKYPEQLPQAVTDYIKVHQLYRGGRKE